MAQKLPLDLLIHVIESLIDDEVESRVALRASHPVTKTLHSLALVSKDISHYAVKLLYSHCVYISTADKLASLRKTLDANATSGRDDERPLANYIHSMALHPYREDTDLYEELEVTNNVAAVLTRVAPSLRRFVFDGPLRSVYPDDDNAVHVRPQLNAAFKLLVNVEEFCSVRDELYLNLRDWAGGQSGEPKERLVWTEWPRLRRLALYNVSLDPEPSNVDDICRVESLTHFLATRPDGREYIKTTLKDSPGLKWVAVLDCENAPYRPFLPLEPNQTAKSNPEIFYITAPIKLRYEDGGEERGEDPINRLQKWVREHFVDGTLWDLQGRKV